MKELHTYMTLTNGEVKTIKVNLEDELADWLITQTEEVYKDFLIFEYRSKCIERKETRRIQSLDTSLGNGFDIADEDADVNMFLIQKETYKQILKAIKQLNPKQQWVVKQVFLLGRKQVDVAKELDISESAMAQQIAIIRRDLKKFKKI